MISLCSLALVLQLYQLISASSLTNIAVSAWLFPAKIAIWVALLSIGVAVLTGIVGYALWPRDLNKHYQSKHARIQILRRAVEEQYDVVEINKQQTLLRPKTFAHLKSDLMYHWPKEDEPES